MAFEPAGYADKLGNRFEGRWVVKQLLLLLHEQIRSITLEAVGDDEDGVDLWVERIDGVREAQQCKARNRSKGDWTFADLAQRKVLGNAKKHLARSPNYEFTLVSAVPASWLRDLSQSARNSSGDAESFYMHQVVAVGEERKKQFHDLSTRLEVDVSTTAGRAEMFDFLRRCRTHLFSDDRNTSDDLRFMAETSVAAEPNVVISILAEFAQQNLRKTINATDVFRHLQQQELQVRRLVADTRVSLRIDELRQGFTESIRPRLAAGQLIPRPEAEEIIGHLNADKSPEVVILHGPAGQGKSGVLYQVTQALHKFGTLFVAVRLDRRTPHNTPRQFGLDLGLQDSPAVCLHQLASGRRTVLILDQLDALRWTSAHSVDSLDVCQALLREVRGLRALGCDMSIVIACRTFDLKNDPQIREWLRPGNPRRFPQVEVKELPEPAVREFVLDRGIKPARLSANRILLLRKVQNLAMWAEIVLSGDQSPDFDSATGLMRAFWNNRRAELEKVGIPAEEREAVLDALVDHMEQEATLSAPVRLIERNAKLSTELQTVGVIQVSGRVVTFCHQSYLDFLIANRAAEAIVSGRRSVFEWLGTRDQQSLFRREQLRQLLFLLADEDPNRFGSTVDSILSDPDLRFHIKQLTLEAVAQATPNDITNELAIRLVKNDTWRDLALTIVLKDNAQYVAALAEDGVLKDWLSSGIEERENNALWLLGMTADQRADLVAEHCGPLVASGEEWPQRVQGMLFRTEPHDEPVELFKLRLRCTLAGAGPEYVPWNKLADRSPKRAIRMIASLIAKTPEANTGFFTPHSPLGVNSSDEYRAICRAAMKHPMLTWKLLRRELIRLIRSRRRQRADERKQEILADWKDQIRVPRILIALLRAAGRRLARRSPDGILNLIKPLRNSRSRIIRELVAVCYAALPDAHADMAIGWLLEDSRRFRCGSGYRRPPWMTAQNLIANQSPQCSDTMFATLEQAVLQYRDPEERRLANSWLSQTKRGAFCNRFGAAQFFLLPALDPQRRSLETTSRIGVLTEKFGDRNEEFFSHPRSRGGWVHSPIDRRRIAHLSDKAWLGLITNREVPRRGGRWRRARYRANDVVETSVEMFTRDIRQAAACEPERFARLALRIPDSAPRDYLAAILHAAQAESPSSEVPKEQHELWKQAPATLVQAILERSPMSSDRHFACEYCRTVRRREDVELSDTIVERLLRYAEHSDPKNDGRGVVRDTRIADCSVNDLENDSINCVRALAADTFAAILFRQPELLNRLRPAIERLLQDPHPVVRVAACSNCLPLWNIDRDLSVQWLINAAGHDERVGACRDALEFYNFAFPMYGEILTPLIRRMIDSCWVDVAEAGATQAVARWVFFELFGDELEKCCNGSVPQRKGVASTSAHLATELDYTERSRPLVARFFDDPETDVRQQVLQMFRYNRVLQLPNISSFLRQFVRSAAFRDAPLDLLHSFEHYPGSLVPLSEVMFDVVKHLCKNHDVDEPSAMQHIGRAGDKISPLLLRLYEQSEAPDKKLIRQRCLDAWDGLLEHRIGTAWSLTSQLDQ